MAIVEFLFPGFCLDVLSNFKPLTEGKSLEANVTRLKMKDERTVLGKLCSCLAMPKAREPTSHWFDRNDKEYYELDSETVKLINPRIKIDGSFASNQVKSDDVDLESKSGSCMNFREEMLQEGTNLGKKALLLTTAASAVTLCLFANMGPSRATEAANEAKFLHHNLVSQHSVNHRDTVSNERLHNMIETCQGRNNKNLTSHGFCAYPYTIGTYQRMLPQDKRTGKTELLHDIPFPFEQTMNATLGNIDNRVESCYRRDQAVPELYGPQFALVNQQRHIEELFQVLLGFKWEQVAEIPRLLDKPWDDKESPHVMCQILTWLLIRLVDVEYHGFRTIDDWKKLHWRLRQSHMPCAKFITQPVTRNDLIYQCMVMTQATSKFRLAFIEGLNRIVATKHCLAGVYPENCYGPPPMIGPPPKLESVVISPCDLNVVGATNTRVELLDFGFKTLSEKNELDLIVEYGEHVQNLAQTLTRTDGVSFLAQWYSYIQKHVRPDNDDDDCINPELRGDPYESVRSKKGWCESTKFQKHGSSFAKLALDFIEDKINRADDDSHFLRVYINTMIKNNKLSWETLTTDRKKYEDKQRKKMMKTKQTYIAPAPAPTLQSEWKSKADWLTTQLLYQFQNGYLTRSANIYAPEISDLVIMMAYGLIYLPNHDREMTSNLKTLCLEGGNKHQSVWAHPALRFPNPASQVLPALNADDFLAYCWHPNQQLFINQEQRQVRHPCPEIISMPTIWGWFKMVLQNVNQFCAARLRLL